MKSTPLSALRGLLSLTLFATAFFASGCEDNPACVFGGDCSGGGGGGGLGAFPATFPNDFQWIASGAPTVVSSAPSGAGVATSSPLVVEFSESMAPSSIEGAFELVQTNGGGGGFGGGGGGFGGIPLTEVLVGDGRVLLLIPSAGLQPDIDYTLQVTEDSNLSDLEGAALLLGAGAVLTNFQTVDADTIDPALVATYPTAGSSNQSRTTEIVAVFDRAVSLASVTPASFAVQVDGSSPAFNPLASILQVSAGGGVSFPEPRVLSWRSVDANNDNEFQDLGAGLPVSLSLSQAGASLAFGMSGVLPSTIVNFDLAELGPVMDLTLNTAASGQAIGVDDLVGVDPLSLVLDLEDGQVGDQFELFLFGADIDGSQDIALLRTITLDAASNSASFTASDIDLAPATGPVNARLGDGFVALAVTTLRGGVRSPLRVLDVDDERAGLQDALLDTLVPDLNNFGIAGGTSGIYRSEVRDLVLAGVASEPLDFVEVVIVDGGDSNGALPPVSGSSADGDFLARRITLPGAGAGAGLLDANESLEGIDFTATLYDRARNAGEMLSGTFFQVGASGPGSALPGAPGTRIRVEVFDRDGLDPVSGARVFVHEAGTGVFMNSDVTDSEGRASVDASPGSSLVTVDAGGFDLFSFHDLPTNRLSVVLDRRSAAPGQSSGLVQSSVDFAGLTPFFSDSRRFRADNPSQALLACLSDGNGGSGCPFGPLLVQTQRFGARSVSVVESVANEGDYDAATFLRAYELGVASAALAPAQFENSELPVEGFLEGAEEAPIDASSATFNDNLPSSDGAPRFVPEARVHGVTGTVAVGASASFGEVGSNQFTVRTATPGTTAAGGALVTNDVIDGALMLRMESRDALGNRTGRRPLLSAAGANFTPPALPLVVDPMLGATVPGPSYPISVNDVLPQAGIHVLTLVGSNGRRWTLMQADQPGGGPVMFRIPDLEMDGGTALPSGLTTAISEAFAWSGFDASRLLFSDIERFHDHFAGAAPQVFTVN